MKTSPDNIPANALQTVVDTAADKYLFDESGNKFWFLNDAGTWVGRNQRMFESHLKAEGFNAIRGDENKLSALDRQVLDISKNHYVVYAGAVSGMKMGVAQNNGYKILVTREPDGIDPEPGEWPTIRKLIDNMFLLDVDGKPGEDQRPYLFGWWQHALDCLKNYRVENGHVLVFAGEAACGKTLLKDLIRLSFGGREAQPYNFMIGRDSFNGEMIGAELWTVDDSQADTSARARSEFGAKIKEMVAQSTYRFRGMMQAGVTLEIFRRLLICVNREPDRLRVLPDLKNDMVDKVMLLLAQKHPMPMPVVTMPEKRAFWLQLRLELPHFMHWLLYDFKLPAELNGRFGVKEFQHPDLVRDIFSLSVESILDGQIQRVLFPAGADDQFPASIWRGSAGELHTLLTGGDVLSRAEQSRIKADNWLGRQLTELERTFPERFMKKRTGDGMRWLITKIGRTVAEFENVGSAGNMQA